VAATCVACGVEETSTQVEVCFTNALDAEGLLDEALHRGSDGLVGIDTDDQRRPILLAMSRQGLCAR
jgi:putative transposase